MPITTLPTPPTRSDPANFSSRADSFLTALPTFATEANALQVDVNAKQAAAAANQTAAQAAQSAAQAASNASVWVSGTTYAIGDVRFSPINFKSYRRKTAGAGTTDPSADSTNWQLLTSLGDVDLSSTQTLTNKTHSTGSVWNGIAVPIANGGTGATTAVDGFNNIKQNASQTSAGVVEFANSTEWYDSPATDRVVTAAEIRNKRTYAANITLTTAMSSATVVSALPSWVKEVTVVLDSVSTNTVADLFLRVNGTTTPNNYSVCGTQTGTAVTTTQTALYHLLVPSAFLGIADVFTGEITIRRATSSGTTFIVTSNLVRSATPGLIRTTTIINAGTAGFGSIVVGVASGVFDGGLIYASFE